ncbi:HEAT repeat domain-containing protein [Planctomycetota bacterium]
MYLYLLIAIVLAVVIYVLLAKKVRRIKSGFLKVVSVLLMIFCFPQVVVFAYLLTYQAADLFVFLHDDFDNVAIEDASEEEKLEKLIKQFNGEAYYWHHYGKIIKPSEKHTHRHFEISCKIGAAELLGDMGTKANKAVPVLLDALVNGPNDFNTGDGILRYRSTIALALGKIGDPIAIVPLIEKLEIDEETALSPSDPCIPAWERTTGLSNKSIVEALGMFGPPAKEAVPLIIPLLTDSNDRNDFTPSTVAEALGRIQDPNAIPALIDYLQTGRYKSAAAEALGRFGPQAASALDPLHNLLERLEQNQSPPSYKLTIVKKAIKQIETGGL